MEALWLWTGASGWRAHAEDPEAGRVCDTSREPHDAPPDPTVASQTAGSEKVHRNQVWNTAERVQVPEQQSLIPLNGEDNWSRHQQPAKVK